MLLTSPICTWRNSNDGGAATKLIRNFFLEPKASLRHFLFFHHHQKFCESTLYQTKLAPTKTTQENELQREKSGPKNKNSINWFSVIDRHLVMV